MAAGKVRAGLRPPTRRALAATMLRLKRATCPFVNLPNSKHGRWGEGITAEDMAAIVWVKPSLVAQVAFTEWTDDGSLRHARFIDLRTDEPAADVVREGLTAAWISRHPIADRQLRTGPTRKRSP